MGADEIKKPAHNLIKDDQMTIALKKPQIYKILYFFTGYIINIISQGIL